MLLCFRPCTRSPGLLQRAPLSITLQNDLHALASRATMEYPLAHSHLLLKRLLALNKPKSLAPAFHYVYMLGEVSQVRTGPVSSRLLLLLTSTSRFSAPPEHTLSWHLLRSLTVPSRHRFVLATPSTTTALLTLFVLSTDRDLPFRQEANFAWLSGCDVPGSALTIAYEHEGGEEVDVSKVQTRLWLPDIDEAEVMWCGLPPSPEDLAKDIKLTSIQRGWTAPSLYPPKPTNTALPTILHTLPNVRPPTSVIASINGPSHTTDYLLKALHEARRNKTPREIEFMKKASEVTGGAHRELMRLVGSGAVKDENAAEAEFVAYCRRNGAKYQAYMPIMAAGTSAGTLHYVDNDRPFPSQPPTLLLVDAGAEWRNYAADVTRCIPIGNGGRFTKECREIYETVLAMQEEAFKLIKPGADWEAIQRLMCARPCAFL